MCVTYGTLNNTSDNVKVNSAFLATNCVLLLIVLQVQVEQGVDAVIVDNVLAIRKGLTAAASEKADADPKKHNKPTSIGVSRQAEVAKHEFAMAEAN